MALILNFELSFFKDKNGVLKYLHGKQIANQAFY